MAKYKIIFLAVFVLIVCGSVFSQTKRISFDSIQIKPYEFKIDNSKFRLICYDTINGTIAIEKFVSDWQRIDSSMVIGGYALFDDINKDGFLDIDFNEKWENEIHLFNPHENIFVNTGEFAQSDFEEIDTINKKLNIYCEEGQYKGQFGYSNLFQIRDYKRIDLGVIKADTKRDENNEDILIAKEITISKVRNNNDEKEFEKIKWNKDFEKFDCIAYWKNNWQKFLPQKN